MLIRTETGSHQRDGNVRRANAESVVFRSGRHISCQIDSKDDSLANGVNQLPADISLDGSNHLTREQQMQLLMRPHPSHVKMTLLLSRNYSSLDSSPRTHVFS